MKKGPNSRINRFIRHLFLVAILATICPNVLPEPAKKLISIEDFFKAPSTKYISLNPNGKRVAVGGYLDEGFVFVVADMRSKKTVVVLKGKKSEGIYLNNALWIDNDILYISAYRENNSLIKESQFIVKLKVHTKGIHFETHPIYANGHIIDTLPQQNGKVLFQSYKGRSGKTIRLYFASINELIRDKFDPKSNFKYTLRNSDSYYTDGNHEIRFASIYDREKILTSYWYLNKKNKWKKFYEFDYRDHYFRPVGFLKNGKLAVISNRNHDKKSLFEFDLYSKSFGKLIYTNDKYDINDVEFSKQGKDIRSVGYYAHGELKRKYFSEKDHSIYNALSKVFQGKQIDIVSSSLNDRYKIVEVFSSNQPHTFFYFDQAKRKAKKISSSNDKLEGARLSFVNKMDIKNKEGVGIEAFLTQPKEFTNSVLLVMPHGGPIGVQDVQQFNSQVQYLASRGYSILQVNYRGSGGYGKTHQKSGQGQFGNLIEDDISSAVSYIIKHYEFHHVCSIGASYGGYSAVTLAMRHPNIYKCVIARFGVYDLPLIFNSRNSMMSEIGDKHWEHVVGKQGPHQLASSPVYFPEKLESPILITAGKKDRTAAFEHSNRLKVALELAGQKPEILFYNNSGHGHSDYRSLRHEFAYIDDFIRRSLNLPLPAAKNAELNAKNEYYIIAEGFDNKGMLDPDPAREKTYRKKAEGRSRHPL